MPQYVLSLLILNSTLYVIGAVGLILNRQNILISIMSIELLLLAVNLNFITFSVYLDDIIGQIFVLFILTISATESAIGLSILTCHFRLVSSAKIGTIKFV
uniref:NADH dehydrogenase subunit 4L n=1 Tax=Toxarium undulatum TaxID=210620 RepID=A0A2U9GI47_9STRA|nr:NADH dehydrogenase subunit 4L [Toxarium undulatum]AWQ64136.1 NADH dehydrogenase subunit 4L [Toxarium undulatum]